MSEESILLEAERLTNGARQEAYGDPIDDFTRLGKIWAIRLGLPEPISPENVGLLMVDLKLNREWFKPKRDNRVDVAGYVNTVQKVHDARQEAGKETALALTSIEKGGKM